ncbi:tripeptidyl-peptidase 1-like [Bolinopsis microptera]|uniref:tripeptidyl-peptidase 1-like n=1 Tax=Bolinopsis microptera TaxID=2820187 RepID=UPI00307AC5CC
MKQYVLAVLTLALCVGGVEMVSTVNRGRARVEGKQLLPGRDNWDFVGHALKSDLTTLVLALKQRNTDDLTQLFWSVSDPLSARYGKFLSLEEVKEIVQPHPQDIKDIMVWLHHYNVDSCSLIETRDFLKCRVTVGVAEQLLETNFGYFQHSVQKDNVIIRATQEYTVPKRIASKLDFIGGVHRLPNVESKLKIKQTMPLPDDLSAFRYGVHPDTLRKRYNVSDNVATNANNSQATAQFLKQFYSAGDLTKFMSHFGKGFPHLNKISHEVGPNSGKAGLEANLDVQYIMSLGANVSTTFWSTGGLNKGQEPFLEWLLDLSNTSQIPHIFSVSYGDHERTLSAEFMNRINLEFQKIGVRGVSVLFASGDDGAGCHRFEDESYTFEPDFPSSSPFVTTVGGTMFTAVFSDVNEKGNDISGGGFSNIFSMPKYQMETVSGYLNSSVKGLPDSKYYNSSNRAYPDVSAMSDDFWIIIDRLLMNVAGTSAATPTVAGLIALANDARLNAGKPVLGFLNPFIYQNPDIFFDVTLGPPSSACWLDDLEGYPLSEGWDPVTGFGTPDYHRLVAAAMKY